MLLMMARLHNLLPRAPQRSDLQAVVELIKNCDSAASLRGEDLEQEVRSAWQSEAFHLEADAWIIEDAGAQIVGYADVRQQREGRFMASIYVHPACRGRGLGTLLLRLVEERARACMQAICPELRVSLSLSTNYADQEVQRRLEHEGYLPAGSFWRLVFEMGGIMHNSTSYPILSIDMVLDDDYAVDAMGWNLHTGVLFAQQYAIYQKELRCLRAAAEFGRLPCEDLLLSR